MLSPSTDIAARLLHIASDLSCLHGKHGTTALENPNQVQRLEDSIRHSLRFVL